MDVHESLLKDEIQKIVSSNETTVIKRYVRDYLTTLQHKLDDCQTRLNQQASTDRWTLCSIEALDTRLKEFVRLHHIDLLKSINYRINQVNDRIREQQIFQRLSSCNLNAEQVRFATIDCLNFYLSSFSFLVFL